MIFIIIVIKYVLDIKSGLENSFLLAKVKGKPHYSKVRVVNLSIQSLLSLYQRYYYHVHQKGYTDNGKPKLTLIRFPWNKLKCSSAIHSKVYVRIQPYQGWCCVTLLPS